MKLLISPKALFDLDEVYWYSYDQFGKFQADSYITHLNLKIETLVETPNLGIDYSTVKNNFRRLLVERHSVFYTVKSDVIIIRRILHQSKDTTRLL